MSEALSDGSLDFWGTQTEVADAIGLSQSAVSKWVQKGVVKPRRSDGAIHAATAKAAIDIARDPDGALKGIAGAAALGNDSPASKELTVPTQLAKARTASAIVSAQKQQIELQRLKGELIAKTDVEAAIRTAQVIVIERLEGLPGLLAARVMQAPSVAAGEQIIREAVRNLRAELEQLGAALPHG